MSDSQKNSIQMIGGGSGEPGDCRSAVHLAGQVFKDSTDELKQSNIMQSKKRNYQQLMSFQQELEGNRDENRSPIKVNASRQGDCQKTTIFQEVKINQKYQGNKRRKLEEKFPVTSTKKINSSKQGGNQQYKFEFKTNDLKSRKKLQADSAGLDPFSKCSTAKKLDSKDTRRAKYCSMSVPRPRIREQGNFQSLMKNNDSNSISQQKIDQSVASTDKANRSLQTLFTGNFQFEKNQKFSPLKLQRISEAQNRESGSKGDLSMQMESGNNKNVAKTNQSLISPIQIQDLGVNNQGIKNCSSKQRRSNSLKNLRQSNGQESSILFKNQDQKSISVISNKDDTSQMGALFGDSDQIKDVYSLQKKLEETNQSVECQASSGLETYEKVLTSSLKKLSKEHFMADIELSSIKRAYESPIQCSRLIDSVPKNKSQVLEFDAGNWTKQKTRAQNQQPFDTTVNAQEAEMFSNRESLLSNSVNNSILNQAFIQSSQSDIDHNYTDQLVQITIPNKQTDPATTLANAEVVNQSSSNHMLDRLNLDSQTTLLGMTDTATLQKKSELHQ